MHHRLGTFALALVTVAGVAAGAAYAADEPGFVSLFDGQSLKGWRLVGGRGPGYVPQDGKIVCPADGGGNLFTEKEYSNFVFRFEFLLTAGANNGIGIRAPYEGDAAYKGMEIQILDDSDAMYKGQIRPEQYHGSVYDAIPARTGYRKPLGEWNEEEITANGRRITVILNGVMILDANLDMVREPKVLEKHPGLARTTGHIGFLGHGSRVEFRNIRVKELP